MRPFRAMSVIGLLVASLQSVTASELYVGSPGFFGADIYDTTTSARLGSLSTGSNTAYGLGFASASTLFVGSPSYSGIAAYDTASGLPTSFVSLPFTVAGIAVGPNSKVYLSSGGFTGIWIYDASTFNYLGQIISLNSYAGLAFGASGALLAGSVGFDGLEVFDVATNTKTGALAIPNTNVAALAYDPVSDDLFIGSPNFLGVSVYDGTTMTKKGEISIQSSVYGLALREGTVPSGGTVSLLALGVCLLLTLSWIHQRRIADKQTNAKRQTAISGSIDAVNSAH